MQRMRARTFTAACLTRYPGCAFFLTYDSDTVCNADDAIKRVDSWTLFQQPIEYCLSERSRIIADYNGAPPS
jgi:hypothetical protein